MFAILSAGARIPRVPRWYFLVLCEKREKIRRRLSRLNNRCIVVMWLSLRASKDVGIRRTLYWSSAGLTCLMLAYCRRCRATVGPTFPALARNCFIIFILIRQLPPITPILQYNVTLRFTLIKQCELLNWRFLCTIPLQIHFTLKALK